MSISINGPGKWLFRALLMGAFLLVIWVVLYKAVARRSGEFVDNCLDRAAHAETYSTRHRAVDGYARCVAQNEKQPPGRESRCRWVGLWSAQRNGVEYFVSLRADGGFKAEPGRGTAPDAQAISGSWAQVNAKFVWSYEGRPVWPPDINPMFDVSERAFKLREVDGRITEFILIEPEGRSLC